MGWGTKAALLAFAFFGIGSLVYFLYRREEVEETDGDYMSFTTAKSRVVQIKVPKECIGLITGRGGSKIKELESLSETNIYFKDSNDSDDHKVCVVRGTEEGVQMVELAIHGIIVNQPLIQKVQITVPSQACGRIIGKNGENIRFISRLSNAKITVDKWVLADDESNCRITIEGTMQQIEHAKLLIMEKVDEEMEYRNMLQSALANRSPRHTGKYMLAGPDESKSKEGSHKEVLHATGSDGLLEVYVSAIHDPEKFWVQIMGPSTVALDRLNEKMTDYYCKEENRQLHILNEVSVNQIVAAPFCNDNKWYRAEVTDITTNEYDAEETELCLYYVDYGDSAICKKKDVYELRTDFLRLRFQAIECILAKVKPSGTWTDEAIDLFEALTHTGLWKSMTAKVDGYRERPTRAKREGSPVPCVELYDSQDGKTINIAEELVKNGFAVWQEKEGDEKSAGTSIS